MGLTAAGTAPVDPAVPAAVFAAADPAVLAAVPPAVLAAVDPAAAPALLAAAATAALLGLPRSSALRVRAVLRPAPGAASPGAAGPGIRPAVLVSRLLGVVLVGGLVLAVLAGAATEVLVPLVLAAAGVVAVARLRTARTLAAARREERSRAVEACSALAGELRAGRAPADALDAAAELGTGPFAAALRAAAGAVRLGGDAAPALRPPPDCAVPEVVRALAACWAVCAG